jgi:hypothetical protein
MKSLPAEADNSRRSRKASAIQGARVNLFLRPNFAPILPVPRPPALYAGIPRIDSQDPVVYRRK